MKRPNYSSEHTGRLSSNESEHMVAQVCLIYKDTLCRCHHGCMLHTHWIVLERDNRPDTGEHFGQGRSRRNVEWR